MPDANRLHQVHLDGKPATLLIGGPHDGTRLEGCLQGGIIHVEHDDCDCTQRDDDDYTILTPGLAVHSPTAAHWEVWRSEAQVDLGTASADQVTFLMNTLYHNRPHAGVPAPVGHWADDFDHHRRRFILEGASLR